jgi:heme exporter protein D
MFQSVLNYIAGVDRETLAGCPPTDRIWAAHLGVSLCLSFIVVFGITLHATGYMLADVRLQMATALVIATVVFMFDRALYQSDWFFQGLLRRSEDGIESDFSSKQTFWRLLRISGRLTISFGLAWVIATFLELAIFSDTISERIERDRVAANAPVVQKIEQYEGQLVSEIDRRRANLETMETALRNDVAVVPAVDLSVNQRTDEFEQRIKALDAEEQGLRAEIKEIEKSVLKYMADEAAEETGQKISEANSGRPGIGPRYQFARRQRESLEMQRDARLGEIAQLRAKRDELRAAQSSVVADASVVREQQIAGIKAKRESLQRQIDDARTDINRLEARKEASVETFRREVMAASHFHAKAKNDPLSRMTAYQELKSDAKDGETIVLFSWMTKLFVIFLEVVPVLAKMFFAPPSVYAARVQARVSGDRLNSQLPKGRPIEVRQPQAAPRVTVTPGAPVRPAPVAGPARVQPGPAATGPVVQAVRSNPPVRSAPPAPPRTAASPPIAPAKPAVNAAPLRPPVGLSVQSVAPQNAALADDMERLVREARERAAPGGSRAAAT